jgi:hypothetical protein
MLRGPEALPEGVACRFERLAARDDFARLGPRCDPGGRVHSAAPVVAAAVGRFGGVDTDANARRETVIAPVIAQRALDRAGAVKSALRLSKRDEEAVTLVLHLLASAPRSTA